MRLLDEENNSMHPYGTEESGELLVNSTSMFDRYLNKPEATEESFWTDMTGKKWFKTGDLAQ